MSLADSLPTSSSGRLCLKTLIETGLIVDRDDDDDDDHDDHDDDDHAGDLCGCSLIAILRYGLSAVSLNMLLSAVAIEVFTFTLG